LEESEEDDYATTSTQTGPESASNKESYFAGISPISSRDEVSPPRSQVSHQGNRENLYDIDDPQDDMDLIQNDLGDQHDEIDQQREVSIGKYFVSCLVL